MIRKLLLTGLLALVAVPALAAPSKRLEPRPSEIVSGPGLPSFTSSWPGGTYSLPYNVQMPWHAIVDWGLGLGCVQPAVEEFARRGYIRRADLDTAFTNVGVSCVVLAYQKPGFAIDDRQPGIVVTTFAKQSGEEWFPATLVSGLVVRDSIAGEKHLPVLCTEDPLDSVLCVASYVGAPTAPEGLYDEPLFGGYSAREFLATQTSVWFLTHTTPDEQEWWNGAMREAYYSGIQTALAGMSAGIVARNGTIGVLGFTVGGMTGTLNGILEYIKHHPYPEKKE